MRLLPGRWLAVLLAVVASAACSNRSPGLAEGVNPTTATAPTTTTITSTTEPTFDRVAEARADAIDVFADAASSEPARRIAAADVTSAASIPIVFLVKGESSDRFEVYLPVRPNGSTGWVRKDDVTVSKVDFRVEIVLSEHRIRVFEGEELVVDEPIGVGRRDGPTPGGTYYLKELLQPPEPGGPYGTYAYGLSGFSPVLEAFLGGQAVIGIHGTNEPELLGQDVSSGCIRLHNDVIDHLVEEIGLPLGTPVDILA